MQKENEKFTNSEIMEGMSSVSAVIKACENGISDRKIKIVYVDKSKKNSKAREIAFLQRKAAALSFSVEFAHGDDIDALCVGNTHGGIVAICTARGIPALRCEHIIPNGVYYMLEGVEDPYNFGYAVRSVFALGGDGIILSERNWMGVAGVVARSSAGSSELINMYVAEPTIAIEMFKSCGYSIVCAGIRDSVSIFEADLKKPLLVVIGGEKRGISRAVLDMADKIVRIDYGNDFNGSLSTASSTAVFAYEILRANK